MQDLSGYTLTRYNTASQDRVLHPDLVLPLQGVNHLAGRLLFVLSERCLCWLCILNSVPSNFISFISPIIVPQQQAFLIHTDGRVLDSMTTTAETIAVFESTFLAFGSERISWWRVVCNKFRNLAQLHMPYKRDQMVGIWKYPNANADDYSTFLVGGRML